MSFSPYIARDRRFQDMSFDFWICDDTGKSWYDSSPNQYMAERDWCRRHLQSGSTVVDCGAHHGLMTVLFGKWVGPAGHVIAYEALPSNAEVVRKNVVLNRLDNVTVRPVGIGRENKTAAICINEGNTVVCAIDGDASVEIVALDNDLPPGLRVDLLKIDVEGFELEALKGARRILAQRPIVVLELHNFMFDDRPKMLASILSELSSAYWTFEVQGEILDVRVHSFDGPIDLDWLASFENPHVFCTPRPAPRGFNSLFDWRSPSLYRTVMKLARAAGLLEGLAPKTPATTSAPSLEQTLIYLHLGSLGATPDDATLAKMRTEVVERPANETERSALVGVTSQLIACASPGVQGQDSQQLVRQFYANLFGRAPDSEGLSYWTKELEAALAAPDDNAATGRATHPAAEVLFAIIHGADADDQAALAQRARTCPADVLSGS